jgi:hypothetical protein
VTPNFWAFGDTSTSAHGHIGGPAYRRTLREESGVTLKIFACGIFSLLIVFNGSVSAQQPTLAGFQKQIQRRVARDQAVRVALQKVPPAKTGEADQKELHRLMQRASDVDDQNVAWLRKQVSKIGVPDPAVLGKKCADGWFLLVLHADRDREFQRKCLGLMKKAPQQWPAAYVERLEQRTSLPEPKKITLPRPDEAAGETGRGKYWDDENSKPTPSAGG